MSPQKTKVLDILKEHYPSWVDGRVFLNHYTPTYSQRIGELLYEGWRIDRTTRRGLGNRRGKNLGCYRLITPPRDW